MIDNRLLQLLLGFAFIGLACFLTYKMTLHLALKIIDLCFAHPLFNIGVTFFFAVVFCAIGIFQLKVFIEEGSNLSRFFPLSFISSAICLFLGFWNYKHIK